ncbi:o-acyltransferase [Anaeramoeba flamelloides]|uniref:O-acyltransferase n=1 Tax=Anaeramoeba flamelloides TaxID=1746091 RepID=A0ABQ8X428_9EUKA|nr:o-acyltransferase [Anaeramoeba flamelloides]
MNQFFILTIIVLLPYVLCSTEECKNDIDRIYVSHTYPNWTSIAESSGTKPNNLGDWSTCTKFKDAKLARYCPTVIDYKDETDFYVGFCAPYSCGEKELNELQPYIYSLFGFSDFKGTFFCDEKISYNNGFIVMMVISGIILVLILSGTAIDYYFVEQFEAKERERENKKNEKENAQKGDQSSSSSSLRNENNLSMESEEAKSANENDSLLKKKENINKGYKKQKLYNWWDKPFFVFLLQFSIIRNTRKLFLKHPSSLDSFNSIRTLSMFWIVLGHCYFDILSHAPVPNFNWALNLPKRWSFQVVIAGEYAVDVFFFLSGFLACLGFLKLLHSKGKIPIHLAYLHRFLRLVPALAFIIFFSLYVSPYMGQGPMWTRYVQDIKHTCGKYWWSDIIFINNWWPKNNIDICLGQTWYLSNDFQFFIIAPFLVWLWFKNKLYGWITSGLLMFGSFLYTIIISSHYNMVANVMDEPGTHYMNWFYGKPMSRIPPYLIGIMLCWIYFDFKKKNLLKRFQAKWGWRWLSYAFGITLLCLTIYGSRSSYVNNDWSKARNVFWITFTRPAFIIGLICFLFWWLSGYGNPLRQIMNSRYWVVFARLTYMVYLLHTTVIKVVIYNFLKEYYMCDSQMVLLFMAMLFFNYCLAFVFTLFIEAPFMNLEKLLLKR